MGAEQTFVFKILPQFRRNGLLQQGRVFEHVSGMTAGHQDRGHGRMTEREVQGGLLEADGVARADRVNGLRTLQRFRGSGAVIVGSARLRRREQATVVHTTDHHPDRRVPDSGP